MSKYKLPQGIVKACAGIVEGARTEPYLSYVSSAENVIGESYADDEKSQNRRRLLIKAVKLNLVNRHENPYELLARKYDLPLSLSSFKREKQKFCFELAVLCGFVER